MVFEARIYAAFWVGFGAALVFLVLYGLLWFFRSMKEEKEGVQKWVQNANLALWAALLGMTLTIAAMNLTLAVPGNGENALILRTGLEFPGSNTKCTQALADDGVCVVWPRWIFYVFDNLLYTIAFSMFMRMKVMWMGLLIITNAATAISIAIATIIGDEVARYFAFAFGVLFAIGSIVLILGHMFGRFTKDPEDKGWQEWGIAVAASIAPFAYLVLWLFGPAAIKLWDLVIEVWIFVGIDIAFKGITGLGLAVWWNSTPAGKEWHTKPATFRARNTRSKPKRDSDIISLLPSK